MTVRLDILRRESADAVPRRQVFLYEPESAADTVATALTRLNAREDLRDAEGRPAAPIRWDCSCLQKKCGACAMVIDGRPALACDTRLSDHGNTITLEPLRKFPCVADLIVDRSALYEALRDLRVWLEGERAADGGELCYESARCLQCGCCLEVCPNFCPGGAFSGMAAAVPMARLLAQAPGKQQKALRRAYRQHVFEGCGKSLACRNICPAGIDIDHVLSASNAAAVWNRLWKELRP